MTDYSKLTNDELISEFEEAYFNQHEMPTEEYEKPYEKLKNELKIRMNIKESINSNPIECDLHRKIWDLSMFFNNCKKQNKKLINDKEKLVELLINNKSKITMEDNK